MPASERTPNTTSEITQKELSSPSQFGYTKEVSKLLQSSNPSTEGLEEFTTNLDLFLKDIADSDGVKAIGVIAVLGADIFWPKLDGITLHLVTYSAHDNYNLDWSSRWESIVSPLPLSHFDGLHFSFTPDHFPNADAFEAAANDYEQRRDMMTVTGKRASKTLGVVTIEQLRTEMGVVSGVGA